MRGRHLKTVGKHCWLSVYLQNAQLLTVTVFAVDNYSHTKWSRPAQLKISVQCSAPWIWLSISSSSWIWADKMIERITKNQNCTKERVSSNSGSRDKVWSQKEEMWKRRGESSNGPQSLCLPPTQQDMHKAQGMPHIYFPSFPFLITTHTFTETHKSSRLACPRPPLTPNLTAPPLLFLFFQSLMERPRLPWQSCNVISPRDIPPLQSAALTAVVSTLPVTGRHSDQMQTLAVGWRSVRACKVYFRKKRSFG